MMESQAFNSAAHFRITGATLAQHDIYSGCKSRMLLEGSLTRRTVCDQRKSVQSTKVHVHSFGKIAVSKPKLGNPEAL